MDFVTRVHVADQPEGDVQKCFRCSDILVNMEGTMILGNSPKRLFWATGAFVGTIERADGKPVNPRGYFVMEHDAQAEDEISCTDAVRARTPVERETEETTP